MINNLVGLKADFIPGIDNTLADAISRVYYKSNFPLLFPFFNAGLSGDSILDEVPP